MEISLVWIHRYHSDYPTSIAKMRVYLLEIYQTNHLATAVDMTAILIS